ncbi:MAG: hypothetical protein DLM69_09935 [Candidatus Chloroheliales bacterium]|nr:MAG: hypothetical protein DLM69_09935 [Chloroflexota bacterium]
MFVMLLLAALAIPLLSGCDVGGTSSNTSNTSDCSKAANISPNTVAGGVALNSRLVAQAGRPDSHLVAQQMVQPAAQNKPTVFVSSKNFTEEYIIGEMYALALENAGIKVDRSKMNLGATDIAQAAIVKGDISLYPEYTGTSLGVVLKVDLTSSPDWKDAAKVYAKVKDEYEKQFKLTVLTPAPMNDTQAIAMPKDKASANNIKTLCDLSVKAPSLTLISTAEFDNRSDGLPGLQKAYGGFQFKKVVDVDNSIKYDALKQGQGDAVIAYSTEGAIAANNLLVLDDNKHFYPPYPVAPVVRDDIIAAYPNIPDLLNAVDAKITNDEITKLNADVDINKKDYKQVAKDWMKAQGLIK